MGSEMCIRDSPHVRVVRQDGTLWGDIGGHYLPLPSAMADAVRHFENREIIIGLRPEDWSIQEDVATGQTISGLIDMVEHLGNEQLLSVKVANYVILVRAAPSLLIRVGDAVTLGVNLDHLHAFDPDSTKALIS